MVAAVGTNCQMCGAGKEQPLALHGNTTARFSRTPGILSKSVAFDAHRILTLGLLHRNVAGNIGGVAQAIISVVIRQCSPCTRHELIKNKGTTAGCRVLPAAKNDQAISAFSGRYRTVGQHLGKRPQYAIGGTKPCDSP